MSIQANNPFLVSNGLTSVSDLTALLKLRHQKSVNSLYEAANKVKKVEVGSKVYLRGLLELSNVCARDCRYCGIRKGNAAVGRYQLSLPEIEEAARWAWVNGFGSLVLQAGERCHPSFTRYIKDALDCIHKATNKELKITLSLGEQSAETYKVWFEAGAHRYLLRVETTNPAHYEKLHPQNHHFSERLECLDRIGEAGFQVGSGVLIGFPEQTPEDLARDLLFFKNHNLDMIGMGPFIPHDDTPMAESFPGFDPTTQLNLGLNMIAVARLFLRDVNIASTTALEALAPRGREMGLLAGANVVMPNLTPVKYRQGYQLYRGKPGLMESSSRSLQALDKMVRAIGGTIGYGESGDSPHYLRRKKSSLI